MGDIVTKISQPVADMWHDTCVYMCDSIECGSDCGWCKCTCVTHAHEEIDEHDKG